VENIANVDQWVEILQKQNDGDSRDAANPNVTSEGLADRTTHLYTHSVLDVSARPTGNPGNFLFNDALQLGPSGSISYAAAKTYTRGCKGLLGVTPAEWVPELAGLRHGQSALLGNGLGYVLDCPVSSLVLSCGVRIQPVGGHAALPGTRPRLQIMVLDIVAGTTTQIINVSDPSLLAAYETNHVFSDSPGVPTVLLEGQMLLAWVYGEGGANALIGLKVSPPYVTFTRSKIGEE